MHIKIEIAGSAEELALFIGEQLASAARVEAKLDTVLYDLATVSTRVLDILDKERLILKTEQDFEQRLNTIDQNTTASALAAQAVAAALVALKEEIKDSGLSAAKEEAISARLDGMISTTGALKTFLEQTAGGASGGTPEPPPVVVDPPADNSNGSGPGPTP